MGAVDPTYPLRPIACILASAMLLLVLMTSFVRQSWNLGVSFLCFWLFLELVTDAFEAIVWSDNADIKLSVYCDIATRIDIITFVVKPMATFIITRRLHLIASLQSVELPSRAARRWDLVLEWTCGLIIPILVAGPIYYVNQGSRFLLLEGFGCINTPQTSILEIFMQQSWAVITPVISIIFYYPKAAQTYYRQRRNIDSFLRSNTSVSRTNYFRILVLASIDILLTLPIGIVSIALGLSESLPPSKHLPFYRGWTPLHTNWEPMGIPYAELQAERGTLAQNYFAYWSSIVLAFVIFGLFGVTPEARTSYWRVICTVGGWFGWKPTPRARNRQASLGDIEFGARPAQDTSGFDLEMGSRTPSFIDTDVHAANQGSGNAASGAHAALEKEAETDTQADEETPGDYKAHDEVSQDFIKHRVPGVEEPSDVVNVSSTVGVGTHGTMHGQDAAESVGESALRKLQSDHESAVASDVPRATEYPDFTVV